MHAIDIKVFFERHSGSLGSLATLIKKFENNPAPSVNMMLLNSPHLSPHYSSRDQQVTGAARGYVALQHAGLVATSIDIERPQEYHQCPSFSVGSPAYSLFVKRASVFYLYGVGNCAHRAGYSAVILREAFPESIKVQWCSAPRKDQFIVMIGNKDIGFFVYDPLLNHTKVFSLKYYQKNILPRYPDARTISSVYKLKLTKDNALLKADLTEYINHLTRCFREINWLGRIPLFIELNLGSHDSPINEPFSILEITDKKEQEQLIRNAFHEINKRNNPVDLNRSEPPPVAKIHPTSATRSPSLFDYLGYDDLARYSQTGKAERDEVAAYLEGKYSPR